MFSLDFLSYLGKPSTRGFFCFFKATDHVGGAEAKMAVVWAMRDFLVWSRHWLLSHWMQPKNTVSLRSVSRLRGVFFR